VSIISTLDLSFNSLTSLHGYGLTGLARLDVSNNVIRQVAPDVLDNIENTLNEIDLSDNLLTDFGGLAAVGGENGEGDTREDKVPTQCGVQVG